MRYWHALRGVVRLLGLATLLCAAELSYAQPDAVTLAEAVRAALKRYPGAELAQVIRRQGDAIREQADRLLAAEPALMLRHENDAWADDDGYRQWEGGVAMPLWLPGQKDARGRVAEATQVEAEATARLQHWQVAGEVRELLWSLRIAQADAELANQALAGARKLEREVSRRVQAGELARMDLILAQQETLAAEMEGARAGARQRTMQLKYKTVTGLESLPRAFAERVSVPTRIGDEHPVLAARRVVAERSRAERDQARGEKHFNPVLTLGGKSERPESGFSYDHALIAEVNIPIGGGAYAAPRVAAAERDLAEAAVEVARTRRQLEQELIEALNARGEAAQTSQLAARQHQLAVEALRLARRAFELGESSLLVVLETRRKALAATREFRISEIELGHAEASVNQALGVIPE